MANPSDGDLDAIVGAALKAMVESGADRARLGAFANSFRAEVAEILGHKPARAPEPDLLQLVTQAVQQAIADPALQAALKPRAVATSKRIYVTVHGKATSVTISSQALQQLEQSVGRKQVKAIVQQLAQSAPADGSNRSGWIQERLLAFASSGIASTDGAARH